MAMRAGSVELSFSGPDVQGPALRNPARRSATAPYSIIVGIELNRFE